MLAGGVSGYQRVSCFRLAIGLKRAGIPQDLAVVLLRAWARKNRPQGQRIITEPEIRDQTRSAYSGYGGYGCEDAGIRALCDPLCPILQRRTLLAAPDGNFPSELPPQRQEEAP